MIRCQDLLLIRPASAGHRQALKAHSIPVQPVKAVHLARHSSLRYTAVYAQRPAHPQAAASTFVAKSLRVLELLSLVSTVGLQACALTVTYRQMQEAKSCGLEMYQTEPVLQPPRHAFTTPAWLSQFAICALIFTYIFGMMRRLVSNGR